MKTLLEIGEALALNAGMKAPTQIVGSTTRQCQEILELANEAGVELARRVNWGILTRSTTITSTGSGDFELPLDYMRMTAAAAVKNGSTILRPVSRSEWNTLVTATGTPRVYHLDGQRAISFWPYPTAGITVAIRYQSTEWASSGAQFLADDATPLVKDDLLIKGLIARWRRQKGMSYADEEAEYEAALADYTLSQDGKSV
jgi:hypothetical protein